MTVRLTVTGRVQGVGFRPAVRRIARRLGVCGTVRNLGGAAEIVCNADGALLDQFTQQLQNCPPPVWVERVAAEGVPPRRFSDFTIDRSGGEPENPLLPADQGVCPDCLRELADPADPRYRYPFISCAQCGPRYTVIRRLPYDRARTSMDVFPMCPLCDAQYRDPDDRRCHGQTLSCHHCGPQLLGRTRDGAGTEGGMAVRSARALLAAGGIIAVKAVGGYNLVCPAGREGSVRALRDIKRRPTKPFAVLFSGLGELAAVCEADEEEQALLQSPARPIVLLGRRDGWERAVCPAVAGTDGTLGAFLPAFGLYALLADGMPLVVTSCNRSGAPILYDDAGMQALFAEEPRIAGLFWNTREILRPADDSVARIIGGAPQVLRRARGYMPEPAACNLPDGAVLALGAQLEPALGFAQAGRFYPAAVPGDLDEPETQALFARTARDLAGLLRLSPRAVVCDRHPGYVTTALAAQAGLPVIAVQHHHAHAAAVIAEHGLQGPVFAACFDGTGYGDNGAVWGGEFLLCEGADYVRAGHLTEIPMLGGDQSMKQGWKSALCHLLHAQGTGGAVEGCALWRDARLPVVRAALEHGVNRVYNASMGRLFDAAAAILGLCGENTHQGRCAVACEQAAWRAVRAGKRALPMDFAQPVQNAYDPAPVIAALCAADDPEAAALGFHQAVIRLAVRAAETAGVRQVALSGGVFANRLLLSGCEEQLARRGFAVYYNRAVPPGDGGLCLGQAYLGLLKG